MNNVLVNNLCGWPLYFNRASGTGCISVPANAERWPLLSFEEVQAQIQLGNKMFTGTDNMGGHARIQIVDDEQRKQLFGLSDIEIPAPTVLDRAAVESLLKMRGKAKFQERLNELVKTDAEKKMLLELAGQCGAENAESWKVDALRSLAESADL